MVTLHTTFEQRERAKSLYPFEELNGSIMKGKSNIYGAMGEVLVHDFFGSERAEIKAEADYDLIIDGYRVDVKTKRTTVVPKPNYYCSISTWNTGQMCDMYFFVRVKEDLSEGYLLGYLGKNEFFDKADFKRKGEQDGGLWVFKADCYNIKVDQLNKFRV